MSNRDQNDALVWQARHFVYTFWVENEHPPSVQDAARGLGAARNLTRHNAGSSTENCVNRRGGALCPPSLEGRLPGTT
jgi:hypothetical protein